MLNSYSGRVQPDHRERVPTAGDQKDPRVPCMIAGGLAGKSPSDDVAYLRSDDRWAMSDELSLSLFKQNISKNEGIF